MSLSKSSPLGDPFMSCEDRLKGQCQLCHLKASQIGSPSNSMRNRDRKQKKGHVRPKESNRKQ